MFARRIPEESLYYQVYGMILLASTDRVLAISFLSSHRFVGKIHLFRHRIEAHQNPPTLRTTADHNQCSNSD
eukprot:1773818-Rhodomonas_salina.2